MKSILITGAGSYIGVSLENDLKLSLIHILTLPTT